jgi:hypothetical protein
VGTYFTEFLFTHLIVLIVIHKSAGIMSEEIKNVFISHLHEDDDGLSKFKELVSSKGLTVRDSSINSSNPNSAKDPDYIKREILAPQIRWASTLVVYITPQTKESAWVNWEIEYAKEQGKLIVGVYAHGENNCELPEALEKYGDAVIGWQSEGIIDAIMGRNNEWQTPSGGQYPMRQIARANC